MIIDAFKSLWNNFVGQLYRILTNRNKNVKIEKRLSLCGYEYEFVSSQRLLAILFYIHSI